MSYLENDAQRFLKRQDEDAEREQERMDVEHWNNLNYLFSTFEYARKNEWYTLNDSKHFEFINDITNQIKQYLNED